MNTYTRLFVASSLLFACSEDAAGPPPNQTVADAGGEGGSGGALDAGPFELSQGPFDVFTVGFELETPEQIGLVLSAATTPPSNARIRVRYRATTEAPFREGHPLLRVEPKWIAQASPTPVTEGFAGSIFDLVPGATYQVELTLLIPGKADQVYRVERTTRALPKAASAITQTARASDSLQAKFDTLNPGDVLELEAGQYAVQGLVLRATGTSEKPIVIRGKTREGVVLKRATGGVLQIEKASNVILENMTLEGSGTDSGTAASSYGIVFSGESKRVTIRDVDLRGVDQGIVSSGTLLQTLVYNTSLRGNNLWDPASIESNATWNDEGIKLPGNGNAAFENSLHGFGDAFSFANGSTAAGCYIYRNNITMTGDDAFEADYSQRNIGIYDNYVTNSSTFLSLDPLWGGPLYAFRNISINTFRGPFKLNDTNSGFLIYNNTIVRTEGTTSWASVQFDNGDLNNWSYRNNLLIYQGASRQLMAMEAPGQERLDFTHNGWFPDGQVWWTKSGGSFTSLQDARSKLPASIPLFGTLTQRHANDFISDADPFEQAINLGPSHRTEYKSTPRVALRAAAGAKRAGTPIANVTDGFSGTAPDVGAAIEGRPPVRWGALR
jgi:hypothetical protein